MTLHASKEKVQPNPTAEVGLVYTCLASLPPWSDSAWFPQPFEGKNVKYFTFGWLTAFVE
jgi:hypothetical protein